MSILTELNKLKEEKRKCVLEQSYEKAAHLRDKEKKLLSQLFVEKNEEYGDKYVNYIEQKVEEFKELSKDKKCNQALALFDFAIKGLNHKDDSKRALIHSNRNSIQVEMDWLKTRNVIDKSDDSENDNRSLNKWIFENIITFESWFRKNYDV